MGEEIIAPGDGRAQGVLPRGEVLRLPVEEGEALLQALQQHLRGEELRECRRQLDGERQAVEVHTKPGHGLRVLVGESKAWIDHLGTLQEEAH